MTAPWQVAPGLPWRAARRGVVVATSEGSVVLTDLGAEVFLGLPATAEGLRAVVAGAHDGAEVEQRTIDDALARLAALGLVVAA